MRHARAVRAREGLARELEGRSRAGDRVGELDPETRDRSADAAQAVAERRTETSPQDRGADEEETGPAGRPFRDRWTSA